MITIKYPDQQFKIKEVKDKEFIFDEIRKLWVTLTPEEWVRQNFLNYLTITKKYPSSLIAVEREINLGELRKRCDIVVYSNSKPWMIVECKEMQVSLSEATLKQILNYNISLKVDYLVITNGTSIYGLDLRASEPQWLNQIPDFQ